MKALFHSLGSLPWAQEPAIRADRIADALGVHGRVCLGWVVAVLELLEAGQHALVHPGLRARQINVLGRIAPQPATTTPSAFFLSDVQEARAGCRTRRGRGRASMRRRPCTAAACRWCRLRTSGHLLRQSLRRGRESCALSLVGQWPYHVACCAGPTISLYSLSPSAFMSAPAAWLG